MTWKNRDYESGDPHVFENISISSIVERDIPRRIKAPRLLLKPVLPFKIMDLSSECTLVSTRERMYPATTELLSKKKTKKYRRTICVKERKFDGKTQ